MTAALERGSIRRPAVAGAFYPANPERLQGLVEGQLAEAAAGATSAPRRPTGIDVPRGILVPHAGLQYSGAVAAAAWRLLSASPATVVILGTNHRAAWLEGIAAWDSGVWATPLGEVAVDAELAAAIVGLGPPFVADRDAHLEEHSIEVQLPFLRSVAPECRIVPLAVSMGIGPGAVAAGRRLGEALASRRTAARGDVLLAISSDMAHYPSAADADAVTRLLRPAILALDAEGLAAREISLREGVALGRAAPGLACGMCGIEPAIVGLAALRALGATSGTELAAATSADAGGPRDRTVGYFAARFD